MTSILKGSEVWAPNPQVEWGQWLAAVVVSADGAGSATVRTSDGATFVVKVADLSVCNPETPGGLGLDNMSQMTYLHDAGLLHNLKIRHRHDAIYTFTGSMLIAVNPFKWLDIYNEENVSRYHNQDLMDCKPHAFAVAEKCYRSMRKEGKSQSILVSGESGAGKTETVKIVMKYLASVSGGSEISRISEMVLKSNPILEAFGNAKTLRNDNSSRFGKFIEIQFNRKGEVAGAAVITYLLEKSRVVSQIVGERNFHIFYQICAAGENVLPDFPGVVRSPDQFKCLNRSQKLVIPGVSDEETFKRTQQAMEVVGINAQEQTNVFRAVMVVLWLGELVFQPDPKIEDCIIICKNEALEICSKLLACNASDLQKSLCNRRLYAKGEWYSVPHTLEQCEAARDGMAKGLYGRMFLWLVSRINTSIRNDSVCVNFIGVLDIFGFESFEKNGFEQFCINYANEKLQQQFIKNVLKSEQEEYIREQIKWTFVNFVDNQECLDLLEKKPVGILGLLDEECMFPKASDETFCQKVLKTHTNNKYLTSPAPKKGGSRWSYGVRHYAREVVYDCYLFLEKNKDSLHPDAIDLLQKVSWPFASSLFPQDVFPALGSQRTGALQSATVGAQFKDQLNHLMERIGPTTLHYVCCIKPTTLNKPDTFDDVYVSNQLRCAGVLAAIKVSRSMYPYRLKHQEFLDRFAILFPGELKGTDQAKCTYLLENLGADPTQYQFGLTKVFFCPGALEKMDEIRVQRLFGFCTKIQSVYKRYLTRRRYQRLRKVTARVQALVRSRVARQNFLRQRRQALKRAIIEAPLIPPLNEQPPEKPLIIGNMSHKMEKSPSTSRVSSPIEDATAAATAAAAAAALNRSASKMMGAGAPLGSRSPMIQNGSRRASYGTAKYSPEDDDFDESRAVELHCGDLFALLTQNFEKWQQIHGFRQFFKLYEKKVSLMCSVPAFCDRNLVTMVVNALKTDPGTAWSASEWSAAVLALLRLFTKAEENSIHVFKIDGIQIILAQMARFTADSYVQGHAEACLANLAVHETIRKKVKELKGLKLILAAMESHPSDALVQRWGCAAIKELITECSKQEGKECVKAVTKAMQAQPQDAALQAAGCSALATYSNVFSFMQTNKKTVAKHGGIAAIISAMQAHGHDLRVQNQGVAALLALSVNAKNKSAIKQYTGDKVVEHVLAEHPSVATLQQQGRELLARIGG
mmetsp:Transcript_14407/g.23796  ORF Transcript_14407/g.23796 Transcript_14407/m.23796 type:complete len:1202 (+) Transcript_14407:135-3740(+)